jgi:hypothetical protein
VLPVAVEGDAIEYQINRLSNGWVVELVNNNGVIKKKDQPAVTDPNAIARVMIKPRIPFVSANEWRSGRTHQTADSIAVEIGPGTTEFVEFVCQP